MEAYDQMFAPAKQRYGLAAIEYNVEMKEENRAPDFTMKHCTPQKMCLVVNCPFGKFGPQYNLKCMNNGEIKSLKPPEDKAIMGTSFPPGEFQEFFINMHFDSNVNGFKYINPKAPPYFYGSNVTATPGGVLCDPAKCHRWQDPDSEDCHCFFYLKLKLGAVVQLNLYNMGDGSTVKHGYAHPYHLHGQHFYLMKTGTAIQDSKGWLKESNKDINCNSQVNPQCSNATWADPKWLGGNIPGMNKMNPSFRDTAVLPAGGYIVLRFRAVNAGWFFSHCHLVLHSWGGMAIALQIGEHEQMAKPPMNFPQGCGHFEPPAI